MGCALWSYQYLLATHSSVLAWRIPEMGEPGGLPPVGSHRVRHDWSDLAAAAAALKTFHRKSESGTDSVGKIYQCLRISFGMLGDRMNERCKVI